MLKLENAEEIISKAKENFLETVNWDSNASVLFIDKKGEITSVDNHVCHANLAQGRGYSVIISGLQDGTSYGENPGRVLPADTEFWFVDWLINRSPYSQVFIEKDAEEALKTRMLVASGDHPGNILGAAMVASRRLWEYVFVAKAAHDLVKEGVNEDLAFYLGHLVRCKNVPKPDDPTSWEGCANGHCSINPHNWGFQELSNFLKHEVKSPNENYSKGGSYRYYDDMYGTGPSVLHTIRKWFSDAKKGVKEVKNSTNPFLAAKMAEENKEAPAVGASAPYESAIKIMAEIAKTKIMEKVNA
jgi:hypothetical protein